jgi:hypothetical protein
LLDPLLIGRRSSILESFGHEVVDLPPDMRVIDIGWMKAEAEKLVFR